MAAEPKPGAAEPDSEAKPAPAEAEAEPSPAEAEPSARALEPLAGEAEASGFGGDLGTMLGRPFGRDGNGQPIAHGTGRIVVGAVRTLQEIAGEKIANTLSPRLDAVARETAIARAQDQALERLVGLLNAAIPDERYHVSAEYLLDDSHNYSYEFRLFVAEYSRRLSNDPDFYPRLGRRSIPYFTVQLGRPLGIRGTYSITPRLTAFFVKTDLRVVSTSRTSAVIRWFGGSQLEHVPAPHRRAYVEFACNAYRATYAAIPAAVADQPSATVRQVHCQLDGHEYCEWEFTWLPEEGRRRLVRTGLGVGLSGVTLALLLLRPPGWELLAVVMASLLPASLLLYGGGARGLARELAAQRALLLQQRDLLEREYANSEQAKAELQMANVELEQRIAELTTLNELGGALGSTLDLDGLLDGALATVVEHLRFDRALVMLVDDERGMLANGRSVGGTARMVRLIGDLELRLDDPHSHLALLARSDGPMVFRGVDRDAHEPNREMAAALGVNAFLGTPLVTKGRTVGILAVDNRLSGRDVEPGDGPLLYTVGNLIAGAIENARLYQQVEEHNRALEDRVAQRTMELRAAMASAEEARAVAEAASETKSAFLANVSHELRTPLTSVVGFTKLVRRRLADVVYPQVEGAAEPKVERAMRQVLENLDIMAIEGERLTAMINDVLDLAKIESGKVDWRMAPVRLADIVGQAAAAAGALFEARGLTLRADVPVDLPAVVADRDRMVQVVLNLLSNAVKFTSEGGVSVRAAETDGELVVSVADTGIGIDPGDHDRVWESFRQVGDTLTDKPHGTGLGLPICRQIVEHHGGRMWLESAPGRGSTFFFSLPLAPAGPPTVRDALPGSSLDVRSGGRP